VLYSPLEQNASARVNAAGRGNAAGGDAT